MRECPLSFMWTTTVSEQNVGLVALEQVRFRALLDIAVYAWSVQISVAGDPSNRV